MNRKKKEGVFYASKVRLFLNEYGGSHPEEFCRAERISYSKMCNCMGRPSYRKLSVPLISEAWELSFSVLSDVSLHFGKSLRINIGTCNASLWPAL